MLLHPQVGVVGRQLDELQQARAAQADNQQARRDA
jgi:hypothetical protein